ncbi:putative 3'-RNA ribose 2'-O-methyltransferase, Hen1 [Helianthus annuus]|nr:putative 3'-RNA ribose 2'-O-methyltransferase, Hen1 [Helianthus annuus]
MGVGQSACFKAMLPSLELIFAANGDPARVSSLLSSRGCSLEYSTTLLRVTEPLEDRTEKALFSPLSKQRVNYVVQHIKESSATVLVDFGCSSGSLLDSLLDYPTSLERIIGVDMSVKAYWLAQQR